jgi:NADH dehydrogenase
VETPGPIVNTITIVPKAVVVGGGFGGLAAARELLDRGVEVLMIDRHNFHTFQPLLYQVATAGLDPENVAAALRGIFRRKPGFDFRCGDVSAVDLEGQRVVLVDRSIGYDWLVLAPGSESASFGVPGVDEHAFSLKTLADSVRLRSHILRRFEDVAADPSLADDGALTFVVVGGGPTGVELSGALVELIEHVLARDFPNLDVRQARVVLLEAAAHLLGGFSPPTRRLALDGLRARGVDVRLNTAVDSVEPGAVHLAGGTTVPASTVIWVAGVRPPALASQLGSSGVATDATGRVAVEPDLRIPGHDHAFVIGDLAAGWPQLAPVAMQQGRHVARQISRLERGRTTRSFRYRDKGTMATIGRGAAVAELPLGIHLSGFVAWVLWLVLHLITLVGFRNRAVVMLNWAWNYVTYDRGARLIVDEVWN